MVYAYAAAVWFVLLILAILNGIVREKVYQPRLGEQTGHVISTAVFSGIVWITAGLFLALLSQTPTTQQL